MSGESLLGNKTSGIDPETLKNVAFDIHPAHQLGLQTGIVIGSGNIFRGIRSREYSIENIGEKGNIKKIVSGHKVGTLIAGEDNEG